MDGRKHLSCASGAGGEVQRPCCERLSSAHTIAHPRSACACRLGNYRIEIYRRFCFWARP